MRGHYGNHYGRTSVGADPLTLGVGAIGTIALAFILLGPFIGTAATVAILRGDPSQDDRSKRGLSAPPKRKSISSPSLPEPAAEP
jgi:hypothetical protein